MEPQILAFTCNWNGWSSIESAISLGLKYPKELKVIKVSCLSRIHAGLIIQALNFGADGIMLIGCEAGKCHFGSKHDCISKEYKKAQDLIQLLGINADRIMLLQVSAFDAQRLISKATRFIEHIKSLSKNSSENSEGKTKKTISAYTK